MVWGGGREERTGLQEQAVEHARHIVRDIVPWAARAEHIALAAVDDHIDGVRLAALEALACATPWLGSSGLPGSTGVLRRTGGVPRRRANCGMRAVLSHAGHVQQNVECHVRRVEALEGLQLAEV